MLIHLEKKRRLILKIVQIAAFVLEALIIEVSLSDAEVSVRIQEHMVMVHESTLPGFKPTTFH